MFENLITKMKKNTESTSLNNKKGITIIMLIITVIMMIIIVSFAVFNAPKSTEEAKIAKAYTSLKTIKEACENALYYIEINPTEYDEYYFFGSNLQNKINTGMLTGIDINDLATKFGLASEADFSSRTYVIKPAETDEEQRILKNLELKGVEETYIVDLENDKYYILNGVNRGEEDDVYEYKDILLSYEMLTD